MAMGTNEQWLELQRLQEPEDRPTEPQRLEEPEDRPTEPQRLEEPEDRPIEPQRLQVPEDRYVQGQGKGHGGSAQIYQSVNNPQRQTGEKQENEQDHV